jgi:hypothetical protein
MYIFYFSHLSMIILTFANGIIIKLYKLPCFLVFYLCVFCFFFFTCAHFVIGLRAVTFSRKKIRTELNYYFSIRAERRSQVGITLALYSGGPRFISWPGDLPSWYSSRLSSSLQANIGTVPQIRPWLFPTTAFPVHCLAVTLPFDDIYIASY